MTRARSLSTAHRIALLAAAAITVPACAEILGVSHYESAITLLCKCKLPDCEKTLTEKLADATPAEQAEWLALYDDLGCDTADCDTDALECFYKAPGVCAAPKAECPKSEACCGFDFKKPLEGERCCATSRESDTGTCCETCVSCAQALAMQTPDVSVLCVSHLDALNGVLTCKETWCANECSTKLSCDVCLKAHCKSAIDTCNGEKAP